VSGNSAFQGGGIFNGDGGELTVRSSTVNGNTATVFSAGGEGGAGILNRAGTAAVINSTVSGNRTDGRGGGSMNSTLLPSTTSTLAISNSTIAGNTGAANVFNSSAGGDPSVLSYRSTIISSCGATGDSAILSSQGYNVSDYDNCLLNATGDQPNIDPMLGPLTDNGGPTRTMALAIASPAVDKGIGSGLTTDQRGFTRPIDFAAIPNAPGGDGTEIGAFELQRSNEFSFGKVKRNKRKGTAKLTIEIEEGPGELDLAKTRKVKADGEAVAAEGATEEKLTIKSKGKARKKLRKKGKAKVKAAVTYTPDGGDPNTQGKKLKLKKRR
jgi:hypothetical protein